MGLHCSKGIFIFLLILLIHGSIDYQPKFLIFVTSFILSFLTFNTLQIAREAVQYF